MPKILLVEDNDINRDMLLRQLERAGYEVVIANNGAEGVSMAEFELPDVILIDISLPVMVGRQRNYSKQILRLRGFRLLL